MNKIKWVLLLISIASFVFCTGFSLPFEKHKWIITDCVVDGVTFHQWDEVYITKEDEEYSYFNYEGKEYALPRDFFWNAYEFVSRVNMKAVGISETGVVDNGEDIILIGDSRTYFICGTMIDPGCSWIAGCGRGIDWMRAIVEPVLEEEDFTGKKVMIMLGVNDLCWQPDAEAVALEYLEFYKEAVTKWQEKGADIYIIGITPVIDSPMLTNRRIADFNEYIRENLPPNFRYLKVEDPGYSYFDVLHYTPDTNIRLYQNIMEALYRAVIEESNTKNVPKE